MSGPVRQIPRTMTAFWKKNATPARHEDPDAAMVEYTERLRQAEVSGAPPPAAALNGLGDVYLDREDIVTAVDYYRQAAEVYANEDMHDNAIACCKKVQRYRPDDPEVGLMLGRYYAAKGLTADARAQLEAYAKQARSAGNADRAIEAREEIVRITSGDPDPQERLAALYEASGRREEAIAAYRTAFGWYEAAGDEREAERVHARLRHLSADEGEVTPLQEEEEAEAARTEAVAEPAGEPEEPAAPEEPAVREDSPDAEPEPARPDASSSERAHDMGLEIERTSYEEETSLPESEDAPEPLTVAQQGLEDAHHEEAGREASAEAAPDGSGEDGEREEYAEMFARAGRLAREGDDAGAAEILGTVAEGLRRERRWVEAVASYRQLAKLGRATEGQYALWAECARQAGEPANVLEALESRARWHLAVGDRGEARRAAEEMLLVDPDSETAVELLERVGAPPDDPRS